jgi:hypothetical protein
MSHTRRVVLAVALLVSAAACSNSHAPSVKAGSSPAVSVAVEPRELLAIQALGATSLVGLWTQQRANAAGAIRLAVSVDGGRSWRSFGTALPRAGSALPPPAMAFASRARGAVEVAGWVYRTSDGGQHWQLASFSYGQQVTGLSIDDGSIWAVGMHCPPGGGAKDQCAVGVEKVVFPDLPTPAWVSSHLGVVEARFGTEPLLLRGGSGVGMVTGVGDRPDNNTFVTTDSMRDWGAAGAPCSVKTPVHLKHHRTVEVSWVGPAAVAAGSGPHPNWWVLCAGGAAAGTATKGLEIARYDREAFSLGGVTWSQIAAFPSISPYRNPNNLPTGDAGELYALSNTTLLQTDQNFLSVSTNSGRSWRRVTGLNFQGDGSRVMFTGGRGEPLWLLAPRVGLWRSADGTSHYQPLATF